MSVPYDPIAISALSQVAGTATATTASTADLTEGQFLQVLGASPDAYNGQKSIHIVDGTTFTYLIDSTTATPATGTIVYRETNVPYVPAIQPVERHQTVSYHSTALEDSVVISTVGKTVTSLYGFLSGTSPADDLFLYVFDSAIIPADGNLVTQTAIPGLKWQVIKVFAGFNFYIDVPTEGTRFYRGVTLVLATNGDPTIFVAATTNPAHYDLEFHS